MPSNVHAAVLPPAASRRVGATSAIHVMFFFTVPAGITFGKTAIMPEVRPLSKHVHFENGKAFPCSEQKIINVFSATFSS